jgi:integrase
LLTFMRRGELIGLHWREVNLDQGYVEVIATESQFSDYTTERTTPKTKHALRRITLGPNAVTMLRERWAVVSAHALDHGVVDGLPERRVFNHKPKAVSAWFQGLCARHAILTLGHRRANFHCLRHTAITHAVRDAATDAEIETISKRAGHASVAFTLQHYKSSSPAEHQAVADRAEARLRRGRTAPKVVRMLPVGKGARG